MTESPALTEKRPYERRLGVWSARLIYLLPVLLFGVVAGYFLWGLDPERDPSEVSSVLIDKPVPEFDLPPVQSRMLGLTSASLKGEASMVNVFASWCTACRYEHPLLMHLKAEGVMPIHGLNYKDRLPHRRRRRALRAGVQDERVGREVPEVRRRRALEALRIHHHPYAAGARKHGAVSKQRADADATRLTACNFVWWVGRCVRGRS